MLVSVRTMRKVERAVYACEPIIPRRLWSYLTFRLSCYCGG